MKSSHTPIVRGMILALAAASLSACSSDPTSDLVEYTTRVKNQQVSQIEPLPEFSPYESFTYDATDLRDPFTEPSNSTPQAMPMQASNNGLSPDFDRPREPLEEFPLDSLRMVGTLEQQDANWALINDTDGTIHRVHTGDYAGQNHGKITRVTEYEVELTEIIPDGVGGWMERPATIAISE